jgi:hypothetical protein
MCSPQPEVCTPLNQVCDPATCDCVDPLRVESAVPLNGRTNVCSNEEVSVTFNHPIDTATDDDNVKLYKVAPGAVCLLGQSDETLPWWRRLTGRVASLMGSRVEAATVGCQEMSSSKQVSGDKVTINLLNGEGVADRLEAGAKYRVFVDGGDDGIKSTAGLALINNYSWSFTVSPSDSDDCHLNNLKVKITPPGNEINSDFFTCIGENCALSTPFPDPLLSLAQHKYEAQLYNRLDHNVSTALYDFEWAATGERGVGDDFVEIESLTGGVADNLPAQYVISKRRRCQCSCS